MEIEDLLDDANLWEIPEDTLQQVETLELEEYLDNLGYIAISQNASAPEREEAEILAGIRQFRQEYQQFYPFFAQNPTLFRHAFSPAIFQQTNDYELTEEELNFLAHLSSLEGEFDLHQCSETEIKANSILTRVLNFRLSILDLPGAHRPLSYSADTVTALKTLGGWTRETTYARQVELSGDVPQLASTLAGLPKYPGSAYAHIAYLKDDAKSMPSKRETDAVRRGKGAHLQKRNDFKDRLKFIPEASQTAYAAKNKDFEGIIADPLHRHICRLVQIKLWLLGTYDGRLDSDIGPVSLQAIVDFIEFMQELQAKVTGGADRAGGIFLEDILVKENKDYWAFNVTFLLNQVFPVLIDKYVKEIKDDAGMDDPDTTIKNATVAEEIHDLAEQIDKSEQDAFYAELNTIIQTDKSEETEKRKTRRRKVKTRGGKDFFRSVKLFFKNLATNIVKGIIKGVKAIVSAIKSLFKWIKNGIKVLIREIKKVFALFRKSVQFVFGKKIIATRKDQVSITTDYDLDFDAVTKFNGVDPDAVAEHIQQNRDILHALEETADFLGVAFFIITHLGEGVLGWLKLGVKLIKELAIRKFSFQRFSFPGLP